MSKIYYDPAIIFYALVIGFGLVGLYDLDNTVYWWQYLLAGPGVSLLYWGLLVLWHEYTRTRDGYYDER